MLSSKFDVAWGSISSRSKEEQRQLQVRFAPAVSPLFSPVLQETPLTSSMFLIQAAFYVSAYLPAIYKAQAVYIADSNPRANPMHWSGPIDSEVKEWNQLKSCPYQVNIWRLKIFLWATSPSVDTKSYFLRSRPDCLFDDFDALSFCGVLAMHVRPCNSVARLLLVQPYWHS